MDGLVLSRERKQTTSSLVANFENRAKLSQQRPFARCRGLPQSHKLMNTLPEMNTNSALPPIRVDPSSQSTSPPPPQPIKDCLPCRLTGAATFGGVGTYAMYMAYQDGAFDKVRRKGGSVVKGRLQVLLGVTFMGLGLGRLVL